MTICSICYCIYFLLSNIIMNYLYFKIVANHHFGDNMILINIIINLKVKFLLLWFQPFNQLICKTFTFFLLLLCTCQFYRQIQKQMIRNLFLLLWLDVIWILFINLDFLFFKAFRINILFLFFCNNFFFFSLFTCFSFMFLLNILSKICGFVCSFFLVILWHFRF